MRRGRPSRVNRVQQGCASPTCSQKGGCSGSSVPSVSTPCGYSERFKATTNLNLPIGQSVSAFQLRNCTIGKYNQALAYQTLLGHTLGWVPVFLELFLRYSGTQIDSVLRTITSARFHPVPLSPGLVHTDAILAFLSGTYVIPWQLRTGSTWPGSLGGWLFTHTHTPFNCIASPPVATLDSTLFLDLHFQTSSIRLTKIKPTQSNMPRF